MNKLIFTSLVLLVISSCASLKTTPENLSEKVAIEINTEKGDFVSDGFINLYIKFINNSKSDITVLKPSSRYGYKFDFFSSKTDCDGMSLMMESDPTPLILRTEDELVTIKPKSAVEFYIKGSRYELICDGTELTVSMAYNTIDSSRYFEFVSWKLDEEQKKDQSNIKEDQMNIYNKLTKLKVQSPTVKIALK